MRHRRTPSVQHRRNSDLRAEMLLVGGDGQHCLGARLEQQIVDHPFVLEGDIGDGPRQREYDMKIADRQQLGLAIGQPVPCRCALALGTMPIAAAVVGDGRVATNGVLAARNMPAENRRTATLDGTHHLQLVEAHMSGVSTTPRRAEVAKDIRDFEGRPVHPRLRFTRPALLGFVGQQIERALDAGNHAGGNTRVTRGRLQLVVTEQGLDLADIDACL